jgi:hypothetical protein
MTSTTLDQIVPRLQDPNFKARLVRLLRAVDIQIDDVRAVTADVDTAARGPGTESHSDSVARARRSNSSIDAKAGLRSGPIRCSNPPARSGSSVCSGAMRYSSCNSTWNTPAALHRCCARVRASVNWSRKTTSRAAIPRCRASIRNCSTNQIIRNSSQADVEAIDPRR